MRWEALQPSSSAPQGTVEERMLELQQRKKALAADIERLFEPLG